MVHILITQQQQLHQQLFWSSSNDETRFTSNTLSIHFSSNKTPTPLQHFYLESLPSIILADAPLHLNSCIKQKSISLLDIVSTTPMDLPANVPTFRLAILNAFIFVYAVEFCILTICLEHNYLNQPWWLTPVKLNLLRTDMFYDLAKTLTTGCAS